MPHFGLFLSSRHVKEKEMDAAQQNQEILQTMLELKESFTALRQEVHQMKRRSHSKSRSRRYSRSRSRSRSSSAHSEASPSQRSTRRRSYRSRSRRPRSRKSRRSSSRQTRSGRSNSRNTESGHSLSRQLTWSGGSNSRRCGKGSGHSIPSSSGRNRCSQSPKGKSPLRSNRDWGLSDEEPMDYRAPASDVIALTACGKLPLKLY